MGCNCKKGAHGRMGGYPKPVDAPKQNVVPPQKNETEVQKGDKK